MSIFDLITGQFNYFLHFSMHPSWDKASADAADTNSLSDHHFIRQGSSSGQTDANYFGYQYATRVTGCDQQIQDPSTWIADNAEPCYYFDFFNEAGQNEYKLEFQTFYNESLKFDGAFLELNTPVDFNTDMNRCGASSTVRSYLPIGTSDLDEGNVCGNALHDDGNGNDVQHFLKHNHYGRAHAKATHESVPHGHRFPIYSHSVSEGMGAFAGAWQPEVDFNNDWEDLIDALVNVLDLSLYHIGQATSPACGTIGDVGQNLEKCARWTQMSAFFPTFRFWNSNINSTVERYPTMFGDEFLKNVLPAIKTRYSLLPYLYSNFYHHYQTGDAIVSSVSERFNDIKYAQAGAEGYEQFMFGPSLMIVPVLSGPESSGNEFLTEQIRFTLPVKGSPWYLFSTGLEYPDNDGQPIKAQLKPDEIGVFMPGNSMVMQYRESNKIYGSNSFGTEDLKSEPLTLILAQGKDVENPLTFAAPPKALYQFYYDDGLTSNPDDTMIQAFSYYNNMIDSNTYLKAVNNISIPVIERIVIFGQESEVTNVYITSDGKTDYNFDRNEVPYTWDAVTKVLEIELSKISENGDGIDLNELWQIHWNDRETGKKVDCIPDHEWTTITEQQCLTAECIFERSYNDAPWCYYPKDYSNYGISAGIFNDEQELIGFNLNIRDGGHGGLWPESEPEDHLSVFAVPISDSVMKVRIEPSMEWSHHEERFEIPKAYAIDDASFISESTLSEPKYQFVLKNYGEPKFSFEIRRRGSNEIIFDSAFAPLVYEDQYISFGTSVPTDHVYGLGGNNPSKKLKLDFNYARQSLWSRFSQFEAYEAHGSTPFYLGFCKDNTAFGVYFQNANAMEVETQPAPGMVFRTTGGIVDIYFFMGPTPAEVIRDFTKAVGRPEMPAYWNYGYQLGHENYANDTEIVDQLQENLDAGVPVETQVLGHSIYDDGKQFTLGSDFSNIESAVDSFRTMGLKVVPTMQSGIAVDASYDAYDRLKAAAGVLIEGFTGYQWPLNETNGAKYEVVFPDFHSKVTQSIWGSLIGDFWAGINNAGFKFDGMNIEKVEPASFTPGGEFDSPTPCDVTNKYNSPYYNPVRRDSENFDPVYEQQAIFFNTVCMDTQQVNPDNGEMELHYNMHNLYSIPMAEASKNAMSFMEAEKKRPFVVTDTPVPGSQKHAAFFETYSDHSWESLQRSVVELMQSSITGFGFTGVNICGYGGTENDAELCSRWHQFGAFNPISRNFNAGPTRRDPISFESSSLTNAATNAIRMKYQLSPYIHTCMHRYTAQGRIAIRPFWYNFPEDIRARESSFADSAFMWGDALLVAPVLDAEDVHTIYLPGGEGVYWYDITGYLEAGVRLGSGTYQPVSKPAANMLPIFIKSGSIVGESLASESQNNDVLLIEDYRTSSDKGLIVGLDDDFEARGEQYWDDGISQNSDYAEIEYKFENLELIAQLNDAHSSKDVRMSSLMFEVDHVYVGGLIGGSYNVSSINVNDNANVVDETYKIRTGRLGDIEIYDISPPVDLVHFKMTIKFEKLD